MRKVIWILLVLVCVLLSVALSPFSAAKAEEGQDYFPLQVGNSWTYERKVQTTRFAYTIDYITITITRTEEINGNTYYVFSDGRAYRKSADGNIQEYIAGEERLLYDFSSEGDEVSFWTYELSIPGAYSLMERIKVDYIMLPLGRFDDAYLFFYSLSGGERGVETYLVPSVGMVKLIISDLSLGETESSLSLLSAMVNGKQYGFSTVNSSSWGEIKFLFSERRAR